MGFNPRHCFGELFFLFLLQCWQLRAAFLNQVIQNRLSLSEQTYPGLLEPGPDPLCVIQLSESSSLSSIKLYQHHAQETLNIPRMNSRWRHSVPAVA